VKRLVLVGGGHAHVEVLRRFGLRPLAGVELLLVSPDRYTSYSGMLPGLVAGHYGYDQCHIDLEGLTGFARARFLRDSVVRLDATAQVLSCDSGATASYDLVSFDIGAAPGGDTRREPEGAGVAVKPVDRFLNAWEHVLQLARQRPLDLAVVGGGAGGVEIALAMQHRLRLLAPRTSTRLAIVTMTETILPGHSAGVRRRLQRVLAQRGIAVHVRKRVVGLEDGALRLDSGERLPADRVFWAVGAQAAQWMAEAGVATDPEGFMLVSETLQSLSHPHVFGAGDIASMAGHPRPRSGVYAVRQGPPLADNLRRMLEGQRLEPYFPQPVALNLISTGDKYAVASWGRIAWQGAWVWRCKDRIDRRFMHRYRLHNGAGAGTVSV
jgi:selenide,water dikinase